MKTYKIIKLEWEDPCNYSGWKPSDDSRDYEAMNCMACGIQVRAKRGNVGVTHSLAWKSPKVVDIGETMVIPRKAIKKIEVLSTFKR